jgi:AbiV family abortive infection protein
LVKEEVVEDLSRLERLASARGRRQSFVASLNDEQIARFAHESHLNGLSLLRDVRELLPASPGRSLALVVLALEELGKIPALFQMHPGDPPERWKKFWRGEFSDHAFKQEKATKYGRLLEAMGGPTYQWFITAPIAGALDRLKQQGFYVDVVDGNAQSPDEFGAELMELLDYLFAVAEERSDSFAQFHVSAERSAWFLSACRSGTARWPMPIASEPELAAALLSLASRFSSTETPDYLSFYRNCEELCNQLPLETRARALHSVVATLEGRISTDLLPLATARAFQMLKLAHGCLDRTYGSSNRAGASLH